VNSAWEDKISSAITTFHIVGCKTNMVLLVDISDDQKGMGSVLAISSDVITQNKVTPSAAMQTVRCIWPSLSPSPSHSLSLLNEQILHDTAQCVKNIIFCCFMIDSWDIASVT
jgi:hypothetical protein